MLAAAWSSCSAAPDQAARNVPANPPAEDAPAEVRKGPAPDVVRASAAGVEVRAGATAEAAVQISIADGYHVNANPPTYPYLIATKLEVTDEPGLVAGEPRYPAPLDVKFAFDPKPLAVYERRATIRLTLRADAAAVKGPRSLRAKVRVQPCDDTACYPPQTVETTIPVAIN